MRLALHQYRYDLLTFWRNGQSRFFTLALPVLFLVIFISVFGNDKVKVPGGEIKLSTYYVPGIVTLGIISASLVNLVISLTEQRESGILKRRRSAPVPAWAIIGGRVLTVVTVAFAIVLVLILVGRIAYDVSLPASHIPAIALATFVGAASFSCLGYALASFVNSGDAAQPITQIVVLPLYFISGIFFPQDSIPGWMLAIADVFPIRHLQQAMLQAFNPLASGGAVAWGHLGIVLAWGAVGLGIALRRFSWLPRGR
jgi:ABC-2 type transport system permease protein